MALLFLFLNLHLLRRENQRHLHPYVISERRPTGFNPRPEDSPHQNAKINSQDHAPAMLAPRRPSLRLGYISRTNASAHASKLPHACLLSTLGLHNQLLRRRDQI
jgi:hypothetical protein